MKESVILLAPKFFRQVVVFVMCANIVPELCQADWVTGVLYGENGGQGANPVRGIELAVGANVYRLEYAPRFFQPHFRSHACWEVGAIWKVKVTKLEDLGQLIDVGCTGRTDEWAREPVLLVKKYLNGLETAPATSLMVMFSSRWKSSREFEQYQAQTRDFFISSSFMHGGPAGCLTVVKVERSSRTEVRSSDCAIELHDRLVNLVFSVVRNTATKKWEIDEIKIE